MKENVSGCFFSEHSVHYHMDKICSKNLNLLTPRHKQQ